jgi:hypothetical protein
MKLTYKEVKDFFIQHNYKLLEDTYVHSKTKLKYICNNNHEGSISYSNFKTGYRCPKCSGREKLTIEYVKKYFKEQGCKLLETKYINNKTNMNYKCICGNNSKICWSNFKNGHRCVKCSGKEKHDYAYIKNYFEYQGCELISKEYINTDSKLKYKCFCGNISYMTFTNFQQGYRCKKCAGLEQFTYDFVKNFFKEKNCELLETKYINTKTLMKYICICKNIHEMTFSCFKRGHRCNDCGNDKKEKSSKCFKDYTLPSGEIKRIQGYENLALDELVKIYKEDDIVTNRREMPKIYYYIKTKKYRYYPDIYIKSENKIIEVKSHYTYTKNLINNIYKSLATRKLGYDFEFWIYTPVKKLYSKIVI